MLTPTSLLIDQDSSVQAGAYSYYTLHLSPHQPCGRHDSPGWLTNSLTVWLLDLPNFQKIPRRPGIFLFPQERAATFQSKARYQFTVRGRAFYYLIMTIEMPSSLLARFHVTTYETIRVRPRNRGRIKEGFTKLYDGYLKGLFVFDDFDVHVTLCGTENAVFRPPRSSCAWSWRTLCRRKESPVRRVRSCTKASP